MNKSELIAAMAEKAEMTKVEAKRALDAMLEVVGGQLEKGDDVNILGFGAFTVVTRPERQGINPATKAKIQIPSTKAVRFKAGAGLKGRVK